jgi:hypothetical protein
MSFNNRAALALLGVLLIASACNANSTVPASPSGASNVGSALSNVNSNAVSFADTRPADNTSILKRLKKDVVIGSTIDPTNGDKGPRALSVAKVDYVLTKGQLLVCNFDDSKGAGGKGTTIDVFDPKPGSKPATFTQSSDIEGCDGDAITSANDVYGAGFIGTVVAGFTQSGKLIKTYRKPFEKPFSDVDVYNHGLYSTEYVFGSDAETGSIVSFSISASYGPTEKQVATGFEVNNKTNWSRLGPSGLSYDAKPDTLYIADGKDDTIVGFKHPGDLLEKNEIVVLPGGKTFKCKYKGYCARLIYSGAPLDAPVAMTLLPNGNLIVANTKGSNTLVELTPAGKVLATKVVDKSKTAGVFGLAATGTSDSNTALFYTDRNSNTLQELEQ